MSDFEKPTNQTKVAEVTSTTAPSEPAPAAANAESDFAHASQKWDASHGVDPTVSSNGSYAPDQHPGGRSNSSGYGHFKLPHLTNVG
ncbi:hypothetical protein AWB65_06868 [Caballeronia humi]|uniref:Uncharacterized protein n=1 Tax=Caballeronia humi TaxID=326474 RepID=A0A158JLP6_9BURK|nr:hypothetical protein AWB65_06868 [Caballeronia humi]